MGIFIWFAAGIAALILAPILRDEINHNLMLVGILLSGVCFAAAAINVVEVILDGAGYKLDKKDGSNIRD